MTDTPAADEATTELVLDLMSFTGPERREVQQRFDQPFADLIEYTFQSIRAGRATPQAPLVDGRDEARYFPDEVLQFALWVQVRRTNPDAKLEDFDGLTILDLHLARSRGLPGKAPGPETSTRSSPDAGSASSSRASRGRNRPA